MKEEIKDPRAMTIKFRLEVANALRVLCSKTGISLTRAINNAVEAYIPVIQKLAESMQEPHVTSENTANVDLDELYDSLYEDCLEILFNDDDFAPSYTFKEIVEKTIEENDVYRNAGLKYDSRFLDFLERRYGLVTTQSRKHSRKRGHEGVSPISHEEVF